MWSNYFYTEVGFTKIFDSTPLRLVLLAILILCLFGTICSLTTRNLHRMVLWFAPINSMSFESHVSVTHANQLRVLASISICVALFLLTPNKQSPKWVFTEVTDGSGWGSRGFSFLLGSVIELHSLNNG